MNATLRIDLERLKFIKTRTIEQLDAYGIFKLLKTKKDKFAEYQKIQAFVKSMISHDGVFEYQYTSCLKDKNGNKIGRKVASNSIQPIKREIHDFLLEGTATDIDEQCSHITTARYLAKKYGLQLDALENYWKNYKYIKQTKGNDFKLEVLAMLNRDDTTEKIMKIKDVDKRNLGIDFKTLRDTVVKHNDFSHIVDSDIIKEWNDIGSKMSRILTYYEDIKLDCAVRVITRRNIEIAVPMYDGLECYGDYYGDETILREIEQEVEKELPSMNAIYAYKERQPVITIPESFDINEYDDILEEVITDAKAAKIICEKMKDIIVVDETKDGYALFIYDEDLGYWKTGHAFIPMLLRYCVEDGKYGRLFWYLDPEGSKRHFFNKNKINDSFLDFLKGDENLLKTKWTLSSHDKSDGKLLLLDCVLVLNLEIVEGEKKYKIVKTEKSSEHCFLTAPLQINYAEYLKYENSTKYVAEFNKAYEYIKKNIFEEPYLHKCEGLAMLQYLARAIWGIGIQDKDLLFVEGLTNSGKGSLTAYLDATYSSIFAEIDGNYLVQKKGQESDRSTAFLVSLLGKRIVVANEIAKNKKYDTTLLKKISGGGDTLSGRKLFKDPIDMKISFKFIQFCNKLVPVENDGDENSVAIKTRLNVLKMFYSFTDKSILEDGDIPADRLKPPVCDIKDNAKKQMYQYAFFKLINEHISTTKIWNPEATELSNKYKLDMDDSTRTLNGIMELTDLEITHNPVDYVTLSDLKRIIELAIKQYKSIDLEMDKEFKRPVYVIKTLIKRYKLDQQRNKSRDKDRDKECLYGIKTKTEEDNVSDCNIQFPENTSTP
jgi:hypothetical protein